MAYANGKVTYPVGIYDVQRAIGNGSPDLGTLITTGNINMWAKYKPVRYQSKNTTDQWDFTNHKWKDTATWWKGLSSAFAGITAPNIQPQTGKTMWQVLAEAYDGGNNGWVYERPSNGNLHPFRLTDFESYNHNAPKPVENFYIAPQIMYDGQFSASAIMSQPDANSDYISLADLESVDVGHLYFGVVFFKGADMVTRVTSGTAGIAGVQAEFIPGSYLPQITYMVYPFLSNQILGIADVEPVPTGLKIYTCPCVSPMQTQLVDRNSTLDMSISAKYLLNANTGQVDPLHLTIDLEYNISQQLTNCKVYILPIQYWDNPESGLSDSKGDTGTFTLEANTTSYGFPRVSVNPAGSYFAYAKFGNTYNRKTNIIEPPAGQ